MNKRVIDSSDEESEVKNNRRKRRFISISDTEEEHVEPIPSPPNFILGKDSTKSIYYDDNQSEEEYNVFDPDYNESENEYELFNEIDDVIVEDNSIKDPNKVQEEIRERLNDILASKIQKLHPQMSENKCIERAKKIRQDIGFPYLYSIIRKSLNNEENDEVDRMLVDVEKVLPTISKARNIINGWKPSPLKIATSNINIEEKAKALELLDVLSSYDSTSEQYIDLRNRIKEMILN